MRAQNKVASRRRRKRVLKAAKGFVGGRRTQYRKARETQIRAGVYAFRDRKAKKREFRGLWNVRINAAVRGQCLRYSTFVHALKKANVEINRKLLALLASEEPTAFTAVVNGAKTQIA